MTCATNKIQINDEWRDILIVQNDAPVTFANPGCIADGGVLYFTDGGIFKTEQQDGKYYYWFIIERQETRPAEDREARAQTAADAVTMLDLDYRLTLVENGVKESDLE